MNVRKTLIGAAIAIPMAVTAAPAMADDTPQTATDPAVVDPVTPDPVTTQSPEPVPTATQTTSQTAEPQSAPDTTTPAATYTAPVTKATASTADRKTLAKRGTRAAGMSIRTRGTRFSPMVAVKRLKAWARHGRSGYHNGCLRLTDDAYQPLGGRTGTALGQWRRALRHGYGHRDRMAPIGAQLFWRTSNPAGHVATYVGNGKVVTNMPSGRVKMVSWKLIDRWGPFQGWAEPYYG